MTAEVIPLPLRAKPPVVCLDQSGELFDFCAFKAAKEATGCTLADELLAFAASVRLHVMQTRNIIAQQDEARNEIMKERT